MNKRDLAKLEKQVPRTAVAASARRVLRSIVSLHFVKCVALTILCRQQMMIGSPALINGQDWFGREVLTMSV